jgi:SAM-dependent methyltransferase
VHRRCVARRGGRARRVGGGEGPAGGARRADEGRGVRRGARLTRKREGVSGAGASADDAQQTDGKAKRKPTRKQEGVSGAGASADVAQQTDGKAKRKPTRKQEGVSGAGASADVAQQTDGKAKRKPTRNDVSLNRRFWDADADDYQAVHGAELAAHPLAWGAYRIPESELQILGDVAGRDVLELGCGGGQWSVALEPLGARVVGLDISRAQLRHARGASATLPLIAADAERLPFTSKAFDVVFCDHGAMSFCDPERTLPEVARVTRPGAQFAFANATPFTYLTWDPVHEKQTRKLHRSYDDLGRQDFGEGTIDWVLGPGDWVRLLRAHGFEVEDLRELRPTAGMKTTYGDFAPPSYARRWPVEWIWSTRRRA